MTTQALLRNRNSVVFPQPIPPTSATFMPRPSSAEPANTSWIDGCAASRGSVIARAYKVAFIQAVKGRNRVEPVQKRPVDLPPVKRHRLRFRVRPHPPNVSTVSLEWQPIAGLDCWNLIEENQALQKAICDAGFFCKKEALASEAASLPCGLGTAYRLADATPRCAGRYTCYCGESALETARRQANRIAGPVWFPRPARGRAF